MEDDREQGAHSVNLRIFVVAVAVIWTLIIGASWLWNVQQTRRSTIDQALVEARVAYDKDIIYRRWNTLHGGVYARVTERTRPNPYLEGVPGRDVITEEGVRLTLINPAYMTRQANELAIEDNAVRGHITSDNPLRPGNAPDEWEKQALAAFRTGKREVSSVETLGGSEYMRLMRPLVTEAGCLTCHAEQGYVPGDLRGGISVAVPMRPLRLIERRSLNNLGLIHFFLWTLGLAGHFFGARELFRSERERREAEENTIRYAGQLEGSNRLKDLFIDIMRHDLINPAGVIKCYIGYLIEDESDPGKLELMRKIDAVNNRLTDMIENASKYSRLEETESLELKRENIGAIVKDAIMVSSCQGEESGMTVDFRCDGDFPALVNPMIGDVFANIVSNAVKYALEGGRIEVDIADGGDTWKVTVTDYGPGISDEDKDKIFTRFERLNKEGVQGTGLGLAIAKRLVDLHGGRIWVEDNPEGGCVFCVSLLKA